MTSRKRARGKVKRTQNKEKPFVRFKGPRVDDSVVELRPGKGSSNSGGRPGGFFWHVFCGEAKAGRVWITYHETQNGEPRPSITVMLNKQSQGRGIGTIAFRRAAEMSPYDEIYATVAKKNIASRTALERAGFITSEDHESTEFYMVWRRDGV